ncbi:DNA-dependent ATPase fun30 [Dipsacomyces acuminosporus]|nr:DNA-dependent ATPase fun30 [Dipsacomyces acuminosporus]
MPEPSAGQPLAPNTPPGKQPSNSTNSTPSKAIGSHSEDNDIMVLESSPGRPGSSKVARVTDKKATGGKTGVQRLSSFYFRNSHSHPSNTAASSGASLVTIPSSPPIGSSQSESESTSSGRTKKGRLTKGSSIQAIDLTKMSLSQEGGLASADFGALVSQFKWGGEENSDDDGDDDEDSALPTDPLSIIKPAASAKSKKRTVADLGSPDDIQRHGSPWKRSATTTPTVVLSDEDEDEEVVLRGTRRSRLQRGARPPAAQSPVIPPADANSSGAPRKTLVRKPARTVDLDDYASMDEDSGDDMGGVFRRSFTDVEPHVMKLFNEGSAEELMEKAGATAEEAKVIKGLRPFEDMDSIEYLLRKTRGVRLAIFNHYRDTILGHAEVEAVIAECSGIFKELKTAMKRAGVESDEATGAVKISDGVDLQQPKMVSKEFALKHYQLEGVEWLTCLRNANASGILADEMGLGKTFQVIAFLCKGVEEGKTRGPSLVVCPSSTLDNWMNECAKFAPSLRVVSYYGSQAERLSLQASYEDEASYDVMVTTYNVATGNKLDRMFLKKRRFHSLILDEGHMVKNCMSSRYKWLMQIRASFRLLLTGTPLQNNLQELVSLLTFILPQVFSDSQSMLRHAFKTKPGGNAKSLNTNSSAGVDSDDLTANNSSVAPSGAQTPVLQQQQQGSVGPVESRHIEQAKKLLRPFVLRRRKVDVLGDLPAKTEILVKLDLTETQRRLYDTIMPEQDAAGELLRQKLMKLDTGSCSADDSDGEKKAKKKNERAKAQSSWISSFMDMRKVADHPLLLRSNYQQSELQQMARQLLREPDYADANYQYVLEDMQVCSDFELHRICAGYPKMSRFKLPDEVLLDSAKVQKLKEIVNECIARDEKVLIFSQFTSMLDILEYVFKIWDISYCRLDGQTKVDERQAMIDEFNSSTSKELPVFLLSTKAGGFGINLTSANVVVIFDFGNNPSEERQAEDRAHRVGQTKDVRVYKLIGSSTIDEDIWECSKSKLLVEHLFWF